MTGRKNGEEPGIEPSYGVGYPLPKRHPAETLASFDRTAKPADDTGERLLPGTPPPWVNPPKKNRQIPPWAIVGICVVVIVFICAVIGGVVTRTAVPIVAPTWSTSPVIPLRSAVQSPAEQEINKTFRSGEFEYTIHGVKTGLDQVGDQFFRERAHGSYTRLDMTVKNVDTVPVFFDSETRVKVEDSSGRVFSASTMANAAGNGGEDGWMTEINPGNAIRAFVFFDLPEGTEAERALINSGLLVFGPDAVVPLR